VGILAHKPRFAIFGILSLIILMAACGREPAPTETLAEPEQLLRAGQQRARVVAREGLHLRVTPAASDDRSRSEGDSAPA
jgi:hypothetical protein